MEVKAFVCGTVLWPGMHGAGESLNVHNLLFFLTHGAVGGYLTTIMLILAKEKMRKVEYIEYCFPPIRPCPIIHTKFFMFYRWRD